MSPLYWHIPFETAWRASVVPFSSEAGFYAMLSFGGYNLWLALALATLGAAIGHSFNWLGGHIFLIYYRLGHFKISPKWHDRLHHAFHSYLWLLLPLVWAPFVNGLGFLAGFFGLRYRWFLPLVLLGEAIHYAYFILR